MSFNVFSKSVPPTLYGASAGHVRLDFELQHGNATYAPMTKMR